MKLVWKPVVLWGGLAFGLALGACVSPQESSAVLDRIGGIGQFVPVDNGGSYVDILPAELDRILQTGDFFVVNVHIPSEGEIPGTGAHIAFDQVIQRLEQSQEKKEARIVLYCRSGSMSAIAARELASAGYTNVFNLDGGFRAWIEAGYPFDS